jgi:putative ABC transport system permease protein
MSTLTQTREIVMMNLRSIPDRLAPSLVIVIGIAGVVGVLVALLSMSSGLQQTLGGNGRDDQAVITRGGSQGELSSFLTIASMTLIKQDRAIARGSDGLPLASGELIVITEVPRPG